MQARNQNGGPVRRDLGKNPRLRVGLVSREVGSLPCLRVGLVSRYLGTLPCLRVGPARQTAGRGGFTLIELLIAMSLTLILVYAIAEFYAFIGETVRDGRAGIEMGGAMRAATQRLKKDLDMMTVRVVRPPLDANNGMGYFEIKEGAAADGDVNADGTPDVQIVNENGIPTQTDNTKNQFLASSSTSMFGDTDDVIAFTVRAQGEPFYGRRYNGNTGAYDQVQSDLAEVVWFSSFIDKNADQTWNIADEPRVLVRRLLLVLPSAPNLGAPQGNVFQHNDISAHRDGNGNWAPNSIVDLGDPHNRFLHQNVQQANNNGYQAGSALPNPMLLDANNANNVAIFQMGGNSQGDDVILSNLLAFDVQVYDPLAPLIADNTNVNAAQKALAPGDPGFFSILNGMNANAYAVIGRGAYVDLGYYPNLNPPSLFSAKMYTNVNSPNSGYGAGPPYFYDTYTQTYERDGRDQFNDNKQDQAFDGLDNDGQNGIDDFGERETTPPYAPGLRGIQIRVRMYEPSTRQVRQGTIVSDFIPD